MKRKASCEMSRDVENSLHQEQRSIQMSLPLRRLTLPVMMSEYPCYPDRHRALHIRGTAQTEATLRHGTRALKGFHGTSSHR